MSHAHDALPATDELPAGQVEQKDAPAALKVPARHCRHVDCPVVFWKVPAGHAWQAELSGEPAELPKVPSPHCTQNVWPASVWYVPTGQ